MNRRKSLFVGLLLAGSGSVMAQSVEDGLKDLYYRKNESAKQTFEKVIAAKPTDDKAYYYLGIAELNLDNKAAAAAAFQKGLQAVPTSPLLQVGMGRIDLLNGDAAAAKQKFDAANTATKGADGFVARAIADANTEVKGGDRGFALTVMEKLMDNTDRKKRDQYTPTATDYIELGDAYRYLGGENGGKAISAYEKAEEMEPSNAEAVTKKGLVNLNARLKQEAVADFARATTIDPKYGPAFYELYEFYYTPKKDQFSLENAAKYLQQYLDVADPADKQGIAYNKAAISFFRKDYDNAISQAQAAYATANDANKGKLALIIGDAYLQKGDSATAKKFMDEYVQKAGEANLQPKTYKLLSEIYSRYKDSDSVKTAANDSLAGLYLEKYALSDTAKDADNYRTVAEAFKRMNDVKRSAEWYTKLVNDFTDQQNASKTTDFFYKGLMEMYARQFDKADSTFGTFLSKYPDQEVFGLYWRARVNIAADPSAKDGKAVPYILKFMELGGEQKMNKPAQLIYPYQYLMIYYYNKEDKENLKVYIDKVLSIDPNNGTVKDIQANMSNREKAATQKPAAGTKPGNKK